MSASCRSSNFGFWSAAALLLLQLSAILPQTNANIFLSGEYQQSASHVSSHVARNPFLEHAIISRQAAPFTGPTYLPPKEQLKCAPGQQCVRQESCKGGYYYAAGSALPKSQACSPDTDVCCTYRPPATPPPTTQTPYVPCGQDSDCVQPSDCRNGEISALNYMKINNRDRCYAPEVCCRLPSTTLTQDGYLVKVPQTSFPLPTNPTVTAAPQTYRPQPTSPNTYRPPSPQPTEQYLPPQATQSRQPQPQSPSPQPRPSTPDRPRQTYSPQPQYNPPSTQPQYTPQSTQQRPQYTPQATQPRQPYTPQPTPERPQYSPKPQPTPQKPQYTPSSQPTPQRPQYTPQQPNNGYLPPQTTNRQPATPQPTQPVYTQPQTSQPSYRPQPKATQASYRPQPQPQTTQAVYRPQPTPQTTQTAYRPQPQTQQPQRSPRPTSDYLPPVQSTQASQPRPQPTQGRQASQPSQPSYRPKPQVQQQPRPRPQPQTPRGKPNVGYLPPITDNRLPDDIDRIPESSNVKPLRGEDQLSPAIFPQTAQAGFPVKHFAKCASALVCTAENYCNSIGVITDQPVNLTPMEQAFRVPLTDCIIAETGAEGKCCRDSNYVDPWPVNLAGVCASRNKNTKPAGIKDIDANFAEIPWQAMILKDSSKTLLCGGAIIGDEFVLTTASCVSGQPPSDIKVKAGEWELGGTNEPLPFQLVTARTIDLHPEFNPSTGANDMAIIRLSKRFEFASHIQPICISDEDPKPSEQCVTTGWGKQALQIHEEGAIMHVTRTTTASRSDCGADATGVCSATQFDACEFDVGSALACGSGSNIRLKGVYTTENACGEGQTVRFTKPDVKWINTAFADRNRPLLKRRV